MKIGLRLFGKCFRRNWASAAWSMAVVLVARVMEIAMCQGVV